MPLVRASSALAPLGRLSSCVLGLGLLGLAAGCNGGGDDGENVLPTGGSSEDDQGSDDGDGIVAPATYRFDCILIEELGSVDGGAIQAKILQNAWSADIRDFKLNILADLAEFDGEGGTATMVIRSGVGSSVNQLCAQSETISASYPATYDPAVGAYPYAGGSTCSTTSSSPTTDPRGGTFSLATPTQDIVFIYAEDDDGTSFNCTPDAAKRDAVPLRAIEADFTVEPDGARIGGYLKACLLQSEAQELCSCIGSCIPMDPPNAQCAACNGDAAPLASQLVGVNPTDRCTQLLGAPAYDLGIRFSARRLAEIPATCG